MMIDPELAIEICDAIVFLKNEFPGHGAKIGKHTYVKGHREDLIYMNDENGAVIITTLMLEACRNHSIDSGYGVEPNNESH